MIKNYYFTYGSEGHPFYGGWTKIEAPNRECAIAIFRSIHPDRYEGLVNCCSIYEQEDFVKTSMWSHGNFGYHEHEVVLMQHIVMPELDKEIRRAYKGGFVYLKGEGGEEE